MSIRVRENTSKQRVLDEIMDKIQYLQMKPGEMINEKQLAEELGVSRTPIREALILLARENFISIYPQRGTYVSKIDLKRVSEMLYLRTIIEVEILTEFAKTKPHILEKVEKTLMLQEYALKVDDIVEYIKNDYSFHKILFEAAGHSEIWEVIERILMHSTRWCVIGWRSSRKDFEMTYTEHKDMVKYIEEGKVDELKELIKKHQDFHMKKYLAKTLSEHREYFENVDAI